MPDGNASVSTTLLAADVPELVKASVTVIGPVDGEEPVIEDKDLVTLMTEFATVVVSVLLSVVVPVSVALMTTVPV